MNSPQEDFMRVHQKGRFSEEERSGKIVCVVGRGE